MSGECQVNVKSQFELDIGGRETCSILVSSNGVFHYLDVLKLILEGKMGSSGSPLPQAFATIWDPLMSLDLTSMIVHRVWGAGWVVVKIFYIYLFSGHPNPQTFLIVPIKI